MRRKFWQFRLRSLLLLVFVCALAAAWWSHRRYCLDRAWFHAKQAVQDQIESNSAEAEGALVDMKNQVAEYFRVQAEENEKARQALEDSASAKYELNFFDES